MNGIGFSFVLLRDCDRKIAKGGWGAGEKARRGLTCPRRTPETGAHLGSLCKAHRRHVHQMLRRRIDLVRRRGVVDVVYVTAPTVLHCLHTARVTWTFTLGAHWVAGLAPGLPSRRDAFSEYPSARRVQE